MGTMTVPLNLLGTRFDLRSTEPALLSFLAAFTEAYLPQPGLPVHRCIRVEVRRGQLPACGELPRTIVHSSNTMSYWHFDCALVEQGDDTLRAVWDTRGLAILLHDMPLPTLVEVTVDPQTASIWAGESIFHLCRSLALYLRPAGRTTLMHASGIVVRSGAVLFCGDEFAGKTTLMIEAIIRCGARPLTNDRALLGVESPVDVWSWPGYASFCEGTLLQYPALARAALAYELGQYAHRTISWPRPLGRSFVKSAESRRMYPMTWLTGALGARYVLRANLSALVLTKLATSVQQTGFRRLTMTAADCGALSERLVREHFDVEEPAFAPWHGLSLPQSALSTQQLAKQLLEANVAIYELEARPTDLLPFHQLIAEISRRAVFEGTARGVV